MNDKLRRRVGGTSNLRSEYGYSLIEALLAIGIIGIISLVAVPNFIQFMRAGKIKTGVRQFSSDLRGARQIAVSKNVRTKISFNIGTPTQPNQRISYRIRESRNNGPWTDVTVDGRGLPMNPVRELEESVYFINTDFNDIDSPADGTKDIVFRHNGTLGNPNANNEVILKTVYNIPRNQYSILISPAGAIRAN